MLTSRYESAPNKVRNWHALALWERAEAPGDVSPGRRRRHSGRPQRPVALWLHSRPLADRVASQRTALAMASRRPDAIHIRCTALP